MARSVEQQDSAPEREKKAWLSLLVGLYNEMGIVNLFDEYGTRITKTTGEKKPLVDEIDSLYSKLIDSGHFGHELQVDIAVQKLREKRLSEKENNS